VAVIAARPHAKSADKWKAATSHPFANWIAVPLRPLIATPNTNPDLAVCAFQRRQLVPMNVAYSCLDGIRGAMGAMIARVGASDSNGLKDRMLVSVICRTSAVPIISHSA